MAAPTPLSPDALFRRCDPERFSFETTEELAPLKTIVGQDRAVQAVRFGIGIQNHGYNLFALGTPGVGKHSVVIRFLRNQARHKPAPQDLCYVNNFQEPNQPRAMALPTGRGAEPQVSTTVAKATPRPSRRQVSACFKRSSSVASIEVFPCKTYGEDNASKAN